VGAAVVLGGGAPVAKRDVSLLSASEVLNQAADKITAKDLELKPGQFRYLEFKAQDSRDNSTLTPAGENTPRTGSTYLVDITRQVWIPADPTQEWLEKRTPGTATLIGSTQPAAEVPAFQPSDTDQGERRGVCGDFFPKSQDKKVCGDPNDSGQPKFYAALPHDPDALLAWLKNYTARRGSAPTTMFHFGIVMLDSGVMPASVRGDFLRALAKIDGVKVVEEATAADGRKGLALGLETENERRDLIVDPDTGDVIGERSVAGPKPSDPWIKPGTVISTVSVTTKVADAIGVVPAS